MVRRPPTGFPLELTLDHDFSSGRSALTFAATGLNLADLLRFGEQHSVFSLLPGATVSGSARWAHDPDLRHGVRSQAQRACLSRRGHSPGRGGAGGDRATTPGWTCPR